MPEARTVIQVGMAVFLGVLALEHLLRPELPPADRFISEYARGWTQPLQVTAFLGWAVVSGGCAWLAAGVAGRRPIARAVTVGAFAIATAGTVVAAAFATQTVGGELPPGVQRTLGGRLHDIGTLLILGGLLAAAVASLRLVTRRRYRATIAVLAVVLLAIVPVLLLLGLDAPGIGQRAYVLTGCAFQWSFAAHAARAPQSEATP